MIKINDEVTTLSGRKGKVISLHWSKERKIEGYSVQMTDDPIYKECFFIPVGNIKQ